MLMIDTNICIYVINERDPALRCKFEANAAELCISSITHAELCYGVAHSRRVKHNQTELTAFARGLRVLPFGGRAAEHYGYIRHALVKRGDLIGRTIY